MEQFLFDTEHNTFLTLSQLRKEFEGKQNSDYWDDGASICFCKYYAGTIGSQGTLETIEDLVAFTKKYDTSFAIIEGYVNDSKLSQHERRELIRTLSRVYYSGGKSNG